MKNILKETPSDLIHGRALYNTIFIEDGDILGKEVLDVGCGFGWFMKNCLERGAKRVVGVEIDQNSLIAAYPLLADKRVELKLGSAVTIPFDGGSFDTVVSWEVIEHIPKGSEDKMFQEACRLLRPGGSFYLSTPNYNWLSNATDPAWWLIGHRHYRVNQIQAYAVKQGFLVERIVLNGGWWEVLGINNLYIAKWIFQRRPFFYDFISKQQNLEYKKEKGFTNIFLKCKKT